MQINISSEVCGRRLRNFFARNDSSIKFTGRCEKREIAAGKHQRFDAK